MMRVTVQKTIELSSRGHAPGTQRAAPGQDPHPMLRLQRAAGNQAVLALLRGGALQRKLAITTPGDIYEQEADRVATEVMRPVEENTGDGKGDSRAAAIRSGHDFSRIPVNARTPAERAVVNTKKESVESSEVKVEGVRTFEFNRNDLNLAPQVTDSVTFSEKSVEGGDQGYIDDLLVERALEKDSDGGAVPASPTPAAPAKVKKAGVDSFEVKWSKPSGSGAANAKLRLDYNAKFRKDADHDPALAEFRQSVMDAWDITAGPHKGRKGTTSPMQDDNYSRADDLSGNTITDVNFYSNDNPGYADLDKDDVLDYSFTAEQTIIDTSQANKVIAKRGPHTATVKGKHPRTYDGVPKTLS